MSDDHQVRRWNATFERADSPTLIRITRETLAPDLPDDVCPTTVWPAWPLGRIADELDVAAGQTLLDLACGRSHLGVWTARHTGAHLVGVDLSPVALEQARAYAAERVSGGSARFVKGSFGATGLGAAEVDAVMVIDSLHFAPDRAAAFEEIARVVRPQGRVVLTAPVPRSNGAPTEALETAGLRVLLVEETPEMERRMLAFAQGLREHRDVLADEMGAEAADELTSLRIEENIEKAKHVLIVAERT